jgi:hypothetical protein
MLTLFFYHQIAYLPSDTKKYWKQHAAVDKLRQTRVSCDRNTKGSSPDQEKPIRTKPIRMMGMYFYGFLLTCVTGCNGHLIWEKLPRYSLRKKEWFTSTVILLLLQSKRKWICPRLATWLNDSQQRKHEQNFSFSWHPASNFDLDLEENYYFSTYFVFQNFWKISWLLNSNDAALTLKSPIRWETKP